MHKKYCGAIFDLDGTLTDSKDGILDSLIYSLEKSSVHGVTRDDLKHYIGEPLKLIYKEILQTKNEKRIDSAIIFYREYFAENGIKNNRVYPQIEIILRELKESNSIVYLTTIKPRIYARRILRMYGLIDYFSGVFGSEMDGRNSTKQELIRLALAKKPARRVGELIMVGDRESDIEGAKFHNLDSIGVKYGYSKKMELERANPTFIANTPQELRRIFSKIGLTGRKND
ncbi:MAG: HAD hydrolase-like protein [bacterium]|nr:HAD hydrolase-like protein [bacterium]